jgi:capsular exopolysaccharide synthesis family protein
LIQDLLDELAVRQTDLDARIAAASHELQQIPPRSIQEARLTRDVAVAENLQTMLQQRYEEARLAEASSIPDIRVLSPAVVPQSPTTNRRLQLAVMGLFAGIGVAVGAAVLLDRVDRRVRYPEQITHELGLPLLGVVPRLKRAVGENADIEALPVIEALRGVRLNLTHAHGEQGPLVFTVTSPGAGDGKSFISLNLALAFAEAGHRTVLIDGDNRRGSLHRALNAPRKPGLMDFLRGGLSQAATIQTTAFRDLFFAACGTRASDAPEMLGSGKMAQFISDLQTGADMGVIVIDSPPLSAGVDAFALGTLTQNLLMVLRLGVSDRGLAEAKLAVLDRLPVRVLGAVLNDVGEGASYGYYRHDSYYLAGYEHQDEEGVGQRQLLRGPN